MDINTRKVFYRLQFSLAAEFAKRSSILRQIVTRQPFPLNMQHD